MSSAQRDFAIYMGAAIATIVVLFGAHRLYESYLNVQWRERIEGAPTPETVVEARQQAEQLQQSGPVPLEEAMKRVAQRRQLPTIQPRPSDDTSALSGWVHAKDFQPQAFGAAAQASADAQPADAPAAEGSGEQDARAQRTDGGSTPAGAAPTVPVEQGAEATPQEG